RTTTWLRRSLPGLSSTGFIAASGIARAATAWIHWARPISAPSLVTIELFDMFCALNGATRRPRRDKDRQIPVTTTDFPASEVVPATSRPEPMSSGRDHHTTARAFGEIREDHTERRPQGELHGERRDPELPQQCRGESLVHLVDSRQGEISESHHDEECDRRSGDTDGVEILGRQGLRHRDGHGDR